MEDNTPIGGSLMNRGLLKKFTFYHRDNKSATYKAKLDHGNYLIGWTTGLGFGYFTSYPKIYVEQWIKEGDWVII